VTRTVCLLFIASLCASARDQGELAGLIQDTTGGVLVAANVTVTDQDSGVRRMGRTNGEGAYAIAGLAPGEYRVTLRKSGFQTIIRWNVKIASGDTARLDFVMRVGSMQQVVTVQGGPSPINTNDASVGTVIGRDSAGSLPLSGRGVMSLVDLSPGVVATPAAAGEAGQFSANGLRANTNYFTVDGVSANTSITGAGSPAQFAGAALPAMTAFGSTENLASMDDVDEVTILTSSFAPEFGHLPGAQVALTTRSGSDEYHGSAFYALRNEALDANDTFANADGLPRAPLRLNQWTADGGGSIRPNRTFFFASYEGLRLDQPYTFPLAVPSFASRASAPVTMQPVLNAYPTPTNRGVGASAPPPGFRPASGQIAERVANFSRSSRLDAASLRIDHSLTGSVTLFGRYNWSPSNASSGFSEVENFHLRSSSLTLGIEATPSPAIANDFRMNIWNTTADSTWAFNPASGGTPLDFSTILPSAGTTPAFDGIAIGGVGALYSGAAARSSQGQLNLLDTFSLTRGAHTFRFGIDYERLTPARASPSESVTGWWPDLSDVLAGFAPTIATVSADAVSAVVETLAFFAQDTWSIAPRLTLTYGLRWEITPAPAIREPAAVGSAPIPEAPVAPVLSVAPDTQALWQTNYGQVAPRFGAAWRLNDHSVLRAGWGIFYDTDFSTAVDPINGFPFNRWQFSLGQAASPQTPAFGLRTSPNLKLPYVMEWNIAWERMFGVRNIVSLSWVGSTGRRLLRYEGILQPGTDAAQVAAATNDGQSTYNAFEIQFRRRLARAVQGIAAYTWSHAIDNGSYDSAVYLAAQQLPPAADRGSSSFDVRHNLTAGFTFAPLKNWQFSAMARARTGFPIDVVTTENFLGLGFDDVSRPNLVPGVPLWMPLSSPGGRALNPAAFSGPAGLEGNLGRNTITGFGMSQFDLALERRFSWREHGEVLLRLEAYNALNHPNPADPVRFLDSPFFGTSTSMLNQMLGTGTARSGAVPAFQPGGPRSLQVSLRIRF